MYDVISIGDTTVDVFLQLDEASVKCELDEAQCKICFNYADKIPVKGIDEVIAVGNAANNAVGSARLGLKTALVTMLGDDEQGRHMKLHLMSENIDGRFMQFEKGTRSNHSTVINFKGERTILVFHEKHRYRLPKLPKSKWIYFSSLGEGGQKMHSDLIRHIKKHRVNLAFNPGTFQIKLGVKKLLPILAVTEVLFVNHEEAQRMVGKTKDIKTLLKNCRALGPVVVVITDGRAGSYSYDGREMLFLPIFSPKQVEATGAGDGYATAFVVARLRGASVAEAMRWGGANGTNVVLHVGAQQGLLTASQMTKMLSTYKQRVAKLLS